MVVEVYARHSADCHHIAKPQHRKCRCPKWFRFVGLNKRISAGTRSWETAVQKAKKYAEEDEEQVLGKDLAGAVQSYLDDKEQQSVSKNWHAKIARELKHFAKWCEDERIARLAAVRLEDLESYRKTWAGSPTTRRKRQERLRSFFLYCMKHRWMTWNPAKELSLIKGAVSPTLPLVREQFASVMAAAERYNPKAPDGVWRRQRAKAMLLLLRWSGLRVGDAARMERTRLREDDTLLLYMQKTGQPVYVPLPPEVAKLLRELSNPESPNHFFWNGGTDIESPTKRWWTTLKAIFKAAGIPEAHPHMLRDTFAVEMLLAGVPLEQVSVLLGHSSVTITEKHYAPWVRARQDQLTKSVMRAWDEQLMQQST